MSNLKDTLIPGEEIIFQAKSGGTFSAVITYLIIFTIIYFIPSSNETLSIIKLSLFLFFGFVAVYFLIIRSKSDELVVTSKRIIDKRGFFGNTTIELNLDKVERVIVNQSLMQRLFNEGTINITGAGWSGKESYIIKEPNVFKQKINEASNS